MRKNEGIRSQANKASWEYHDQEITLGSLRAAHSQVWANAGQESESSDFIFATMGGYFFLGNRLCVKIAA